MVRTRVGKGNRFRIPLPFPYLPNEYPYPYPYPVRVEEHCKRENFENFYKKIIIPEPLNGSTI